MLLGQVGLGKGLTRLSDDDEDLMAEKVILTVSFEESPTFLPTNLFIHSEVLSPSLDINPGTTRGMLMANGDLLGERGRWAGDGEVAGDVGEEGDERFTSESVDAPPRTGWSFRHCVQ